MELILYGQRLLVLEFLSIGSDALQVNQLNWSDELYPGEFDHLRNCDLYCEETCEPVLPRLRGGESDTVTLKVDKLPNSEVLQVLHINTRQNIYLRFRS